MTTGSNMIDVRKLRASDAVETSLLFVDVIKKLKFYYTKKEIQENIDEYSTKSLRILINKRKRIFRGAIFKGKLVGVVACELPKNTDICWVTWLMVRKRYWRLKVGSALMKSIEKSGKGRWSAIQCNVRIKNRISNEFFRVLGYKKIATIRREPQIRNAYKWEKQLV
jgi:ribosomal protein S18 acetylase RimI-like enzyme